MSEPIEITPALLAEIKNKCNRLMDLKGLETTAYHDYWRELITPGNTLCPAVVYAMADRIIFLTKHLFGDMLPPDDPVFRAEELDKEVKDLRAENERLRAAQCWVIVDEDGDTVDGPFFTEEQAKEDLIIMEYNPGRFDKFMSYKVEPWKGGAE